MLAVLGVFLVLLASSYFIVGWFVRKCATRTVKIQVPAPDGSTDADGNPAMVTEEVLRPFLWVFVPERTTAYLQRKSNQMLERGKGSKSTPATGSGIFDMIHAVPGKILVRDNITNLNEWHLRDTEPGEEETHRRGLFYHLYGAHWISFFAELRIVKVREVRLAIDEDELRQYQQALRKWHDGGKQGQKPAEPRYEEQPKSYNTPFPYFSREHDVIIRGAETAGAYTIDIYTKAVYEETYPIKARTEVADPNATLSTLIEESVTTEAGAHEPEYFLYEKDADGKQFEDKPLKERKDHLRRSVADYVKDQAQQLIGITLKKFIVPSIDMDEKQRVLLELQETTEREEQAAIRKARREVTVAIHNARKAAVAASGEKHAQMQLNLAAEDHVKRVIAPIAEDPRRVAVRFAEAYESNKTVTTFAGGGNISNLIPGNLIVPASK